MASSSNNSSHIRHTSTTFTATQGLIDTTTISKNTISQYNAAKQINLATKNISDYQQMLETTMNSSLKDLLTS